MQINKQSILDFFSLKWSKWGALRKLFVIIAILFLLLWLSMASVFALPVVTFAYFFTMVIKNIMDIHANWKWGSIWPKKREESYKEVGGTLSMSQEETFIKFPKVDPRTPEFQTNFKSLKKENKKELSIKDNRPKEINKKFENVSKINNKSSEIQAN